jgi:hypothetical protein
MNESQPILSRMFDTDGTPRDRALWLVFAGIVASQLLAFFVVCEHQVQRAEARHAQVQASVPDCGATGGQALQCDSQTADAGSTPASSHVR